MEVSFVKTSDDDPNNNNVQKSVKITSSDQARYSALYKKGWRTIRRWIEKGEKSGEPCPLQSASAMLNWWPRHFSWRVPSEIEDAARAEHASTVAVSPQASSSAAPSVSSKQESIDLESFDPEEGDRLRELKQIQAAKFSQFKNALKDGLDCSHLETKYLKLCETIDKIESRVTERLKKRGLFILRSEVERDLASAAELLRQSQSSMDRRVQELCPSLNAEQRKEVSEAIARARRAEERILGHLPSLTQDDLLKELAA